MVSQNRNHPYLLELIEKGEILREREDLVVVHSGGRVHKFPLTAEAGAQLDNGYLIFSYVDTYIFGGYDVLYTDVPNYPMRCLSYEYIKTDDYSPDPNVFYSDTILFLARLSAAGITHGDMTHPNVIYSLGMLFPIDWDQAQASWLQSNSPRKRPEPDLVHLLETAIRYEGDTRRIFRRYLAIREHFRHLPRQRFCDFGCYSGEMVALAALDGFTAYGYDKDDNFNRRLELATVSFRKRDLVEHDYSDTLATRMMTHSQVSIFLSAFPYMFKESESQTILFMREVIEHSTMFFFETQLWGDGPGPEFLKTKEDVTKFLVEVCGAANVEEVISIEVGGRNAVRTTFVVK